MAQKDNNSDNTAKKKDVFAISPDMVTATEDLSSISGSAIKVLKGFSGPRKDDQPLAIYKLKLPEFEIGMVYAYQRFGPAGNRYDPYMITPGNMEVLKPDMEAVFMLLQLKDGKYLAVTPIASEQAHAVIVNQNNELYLNLDNFGLAAVTGDLPLYATAVSENPFEATNAAWTKAFEGNDYGKMRGQKEYYDKFNYLGWCSWESYKKGISEEIMLEVIEVIKKDQHPIRWLLIDDGHSLGVEGISPNKKFPNGYAKIKEAMKGTQMTWLGLWYSSLCRQFRGIRPPGDLGEFAEYVTSNLGNRWAGGPKPTEEAMEKWWDYMYARGAQEADFLKIDFIKDLITAYGKKPGQAPAHGMEINGTQVATWYRKAMEEATHKRGKGLMNCNGNNFPNPFFAKYSNSSRCSRDYSKNNLKSAIFHIAMSYHNTLWIGQVHWGDHDMFHSDDEFAGEIMAVTKALSGGPVYLSDVPDHINSDNVAPLCYRDGKLLRPTAPAVASMDSLFENPMQPSKAYKAFAPVNNDTVSVHVMNLARKPTALKATITADDYRNGDAMAQPYPGLRDVSAEGLVYFDVMAKAGKKMGTSESVELGKPLEHKLIQLTAIRNGWAFLGRSDKYLSAAAGKVSAQTNKQLAVTLHEAGPIAVYSASGAPKAEGLTFTDAGNGIYLANMPVGDNIELTITR